MKSLLLTGVFLYFGLGLFLYLGQRSFIYFPVQETHSKFKENKFKEKVFENEGHRIQATVLNEGSDKAIIYFGGNAENVQFNSESFSKYFSEYTLYLINYRGYGGSTGKPTEEGIYSDAIHIYNMVSKEHNEISVIGRSLGSAVATYLASEKQVAKLVLITPFDSVQSVAQSQFPIYPMSFLLKDKHDSYARAGEIKADILVIAAENDRVIKMKHTKRLLDGFTNKARFHVIEGANHNNLSSNPEYFNLLVSFM